MGSLVVSPLASSRVARLVVLVALGASLAGCGRACGGAGSQGAAADAGRAEVPAPPDLLVEGVAGAPQATWAKVQRVLGGTAALLPLSPGGLLVAMAGLDAELGPEVDGASPAYVVAAGTLEAPRWVLAVRLADPRKVRTRLAADGGAAASDAGLTRVPSRSRAPDATAAVTDDGFLLVGPDDAAIDALAGYVTGTLARRPTPPASLAVHVPRPALAGPWKAQLEGGWARARAFLLSSADDARAAHGGRAADLGEPTEVVKAVDRLAEGLVATVASLDHVDVTLDLRDDGLHLDGDLAPAAGGAGDAARAWLGGLRTGSAEPVLTAPGEARLALFARGDAASRAESARSVGDGVARALGPRLPPKDRERLDAALVGFAASRGEGTTAAWLGGEGYGGVAFAFDAPKPDAAALAARELVAAASAPAALRELLRVRTVTVRDADAPPFGKGQLVGAEPDAASANGPRGARGGAGARLPELAWAHDGTRLVLAGGDDPLRLVRAFGHGGTLAEHAAASRVVRALGSDVALVALGRPPFRAVPPDEAPVTLVVRREAPSGTARGSLEIGTSWLRAMAPRLGGL